jgi:subtilisin family serine protease
MNFRRILVPLLVGLLAFAGMAVRASAQTAPAVPGEVIVKYSAGVPAAMRSLVLTSVPGTLPVSDFDFIDAQLVRVNGMSTADAIAALRQNPNVVYAEPNYILRAYATPNDPRFAELYGMRNTGQTGGTAGADIRATSAWDIFTGDPNLKIGVIDTGVDYTHPDLVNNVWTNPGEIPGNGIDDDGNGYIDDVHGYDFVNNDGDPMDDHYHGTHCSGTIAGEGDNGIGVAGVNWHAKIVGIKFLDASGSGSTAAAISGIQYAIAVGCRLTSNSWGGGGVSQALEDAINAAGAAGQLFVCAAGNAGSNIDATPSYPASYASQYIISVAATDHNDGLASFSNYGLTSVDLGAPGVDILSCQPGGQYQLLSGTSMATPHVAGACGLAWGRFPSATNLQIKQLIMSKADPIPSLTGKCVTGARLNVFMAIADPDSIPPGAVADLGTNNPGSTTMGLAWTATGDDGTVGRASRYDIRFSTNPINDANFSLATPVAGPNPQTSGSPETFEVSGLTYSTTYYFALKVADEFGNTGTISNTASGTTLGIPTIGVSPALLTQTLLTGATSDQVVTVSNNGEGRLDWTAPTPEILLAKSGLVQKPVVQQELKLGKGEIDPRPGLLGSGGPDAFGYRWRDSDEPGGPAFSWVDITTLGTNAGLASDDGITAAIPMPFSFPYYGSSFSSVRIATNGFLTFTGTTSPYGNAALPSSAGVPNMVAPFWDDLDMSATGEVYTYYDGTRFIIEWAAVPHYSAGGPYTFEAILSPSGEIKFQYQTVGTNVTNSNTIGIQDGAKAVGLTVAYNTAYVKDNLAISLMPLAQWMTVSPASGRLAAGSSAPVTVHFDAAGLMGGTYAGNVRFLSNDPVNSPKLVPASLTVIGAPNIVAAPATTAFGQQYVGGTYTATLTVTNNGTDVLNVTGITAAGVSASPDVFTVPASSAQNVTVTWHPTTIGALAGSLAIASNDPDTPVVTVLATGDAVAAPSFSVSPGSFEETLPTNTAVSRNLRITNGGGSNLTWASTTLTNGAASHPRQVPSAVVAKGGLDVESGPAPTNLGGPDAFGYRWADSREAGGPAFGWVDISAVGTAVAFNGDDQNLGPFPVGFSFPYYGTTFTTFRMCTNGWLSFTNTSTAYSNSALPSNASGVPENMIAPFWDDLTFGSAGTAYYYNDGTRLIVEWKGVPRLGDTANGNTFEVILYPDGRIYYQYLAINAATLNSHTIGNQDAARTDGLQQVYNNAAFVANSLAVRISPPARWLTVTPQSGTIPAGGYTDLTVGFNASGMLGGDASGVVQINSNDPVVPQFNVSALLHVIGVPDIAVTPAALAFDTTFTGSAGVRQVTVQNIGTDPLVVDQFSFSDPAYSTSAGAVTLPPLSSTIVNVTFSPTAVQAYPATLTVKSNDPDSPEKYVALTGFGALAPGEHLSQPSWAVDVPLDFTRTLDLVISNPGGSNLYWSAGASVSGASRTTYPALTLAKGQVDPRPGILGTGGPDAAGYRWKDSDEAGGPAYNWVDITSVGQAHPELLSDDITVAGFPIGFSFPFYGGSFSSVNICSNGYISLSALDALYLNSPLPSTGAPANLIAPLWDDLNPSTAGAIYTYNDGSRYIIEYAGVPGYAAGTGPYTFEVILYPSGKIVYQYQTLGATPTSATVGIQNATKDVGLQVAYNTAYLKNNFAVQLSRMPTWLTTTATSGTIVPGGSAIIPLEASAVGMAEGVYPGNVRITSNAPGQGVIDFPVEMRVVGSPVGTLLSTFVANPVSAGIELRWQLADPNAFTSLSVERATEAGGAWDVLDLTPVQGSDGFTVVDQAVADGQSYLYRLMGVSSRGTVTTLGQITGTAGHAITEFAISRIAPNPSRGPATVEFTVPRTANVKIAVLDVQGREVDVLTSGDRAPGRYQLTWSGDVHGRRAASGLYFVRMQAPGVQVTRRVVVSR